MLLEARQKLVFIGDSITDGQRTTTAGPYGEGYVNLVRSLLIARHPGLHLTIVNKGIGGDSTRELAKRWQQDVIAEKPDWLSINIGINDAWKQVLLPEYIATLRRLLDWTRQEIGARFILMQPYFIEPDRTDWERQRMDEYGAAIGKLAGEYAAILVESQAAFDAVLRETEPGDWSKDRIHLDLSGHAVLALALLQALQVTL